MKTKQRFVMSPDFIKDLEEFPLSSGKDGFAQDYNRRTFLNNILNSDINVMFNCPNDEFQHIREDSEYVSWLMQTVAETGIKRIFVSKNASEMSFLENDSVPTDMQRNNIYLKSFSESETKAAESHGVLAVTPDEIMSDSSLYGNNGGQMNSGSKSMWNLKGFKKTCNSIIVADKYILTKDKRMNLYPLLDEFIPKQKVDGFTIFIYTLADQSNQNEQQYFKSQWTEINRWLKSHRDYEIELVLYASKNRDFHNRHILTNYHIVDCPAGFDQVGERDLAQISNRNGNLAYRTNNAPIKTISDSHSTNYNIFFPMFSLMTNSGAMDDYLGSLDEIRKIMDPAKKRLRVDRNYMARTKTDDIVNSRLFNSLNIE